MTFSDKLRILLDERELTQKQLSAELQIPASTLGGYVQGTSEPDFFTLKKIASFFQVSTDYLLDVPEVSTDSEAEKELLRVFRSQKPDQQKIYVKQGKAFYVE